VLAGKPAQHLLGALPDGQPLGLAYCVLRHLHHAACLPAGTDKTTVIHRPAELLDDFSCRWER
jgi:hypothetical protein